MPPLPVSRAATAKVSEPIVVAVAVQWRGRIGLFRRSSAVDHDRGRWHCITGYVEADSQPHAQALLELEQETGLGRADLESFEAHDILKLPDGPGTIWTVHTFKAVTTRRRLQLNDEHDTYRWVQPKGVSRFSNRVEWLGSVLDATGVLQADEPAGLRSRQASG